MQLFDTRSDAALKRWREEIGRAVLNLDVRPIGETPFRSAIAQRLDQAGVRVVHWRHSPALTIREKHMVKGGEASYTLIYPLSGSLDVRHLGREMLLQPGEAVLMHNGEPGMIGSPQGCSFMAILLEEKLVDGATAAHALARIVPFAEQGLALLRGYVDCLTPEPEALSAPLAAMAGRHVAELASLAIGHGIADADPGSAGSNAARLSMALRFIAEKFCDPELDERSVAARQGISVRHLQRILERGGVRFSRHLAGLRLSAAHAVLIDPAQKGRRVADIALECGFSDISHFNRLFRSAYDASPTAVRSQRAS